MQFNSFSELISSINSMLEVLPEKRKTESLVLANDALATIKSRIIETGIDAEGNKMGDGSGDSPYSEAVVPYWYFSNKPSNRNAKTQAKKLLEKRGYHVSYRDWREQHDLPTDKVTTVFTGAMWKSISAELLEHGKEQSIIEIRSRDDDNQKKLGYLSGQYGPLLRLSKEELEDLQEDNNERILECHRQFGIL